MASTKASATSALLVRLYRAQSLILLHWICLGCNFRSCPGLAKVMIESAKKNPNQKCAAARTAPADLLSPIADRGRSYEGLRSARKTK